MAWKKPKWVQNIQKAADNVVKPVTTAAPIKAIQQAAAAAAKPAQQAVQKAADKVGDVVRPAAQNVAKEVGYVVNPIAGEVAMRAKQIANDPNVKKAGDAIVDKVINPITTSAPVKAVQQAAQQAANTAPQAIAEAPARAIQSIQRIARDTPARSAGTTGEVLPYLTKIVPDAVGDVVRGTGRTAAGILTGNTDKITSGAGMVGRGAWDTVKHGVMGALPFFNAATRNTDGTMGGGRSAGTLEEVEEEKEKEKENTIPPKKEESMSSKIGGAVMAGADTIVNAGKAGAEWVNRATDNMVVKGFSTSYGNVATQKDLNRFREAEKRGDIAEMDRIRAEMKAKQQQQGVR